MEGRKDDVEKARFDLIPPEPLWALATILTFGAKKYDDRNWEKGMSWGRVFGALMRHMWCWWVGPHKQATHSFLFGPTDDETQHSHLWHAMCCLAFLITYEERQIGTDDRAGADLTNYGYAGVSEDTGLSSCETSGEPCGGVSESP